MGRSSRIWTQGGRAAGFNTLPIRIDAHHRHSGLRNLDHFVGLKTDRLDSNGDIDGGTSGTERTSKKAYAVTDKYRFGENDAVECNRHPSVATVSSCLVETSLIDEREDDTSKYRAQPVGVLGHHVDANRKMFSGILRHCLIIFARVQLHKLGRGG